MLALAAPVAHRHPVPPPATPPTGTWLVRLAAALAIAAVATALVREERRLLVDPVGGSQRGGDTFAAAHRFGSSIQTHARRAGRLRRPGR